MHDESDCTFQEYLWPWCAFPRFVRVRKAVEKQLNTMNIKWCDCWYYDHTGFLCVHIYQLLDDMSLNMLCFHHWNVYDDHYGDNTK